MEIALICGSNTTRLVDLDSGTVFQFENSEGYYMATDEYEAETRLIVDLKDGIILKEMADSEVIIRNDLIITIKRG